MSHNTVTVKRAHPFWRGMRDLLLLEIRVLIFALRLCGYVTGLLIKGAVYTGVWVAATVQKYRRRRADRFLC